MKTTYPDSLRSQSIELWMQHISDTRKAVSEHIAALEVTTAIWRNENPRRDRCDRSWSSNK